MSDREELLRHIVDEAVVHEHVVLSSGKEAEYYIDMRRITLSGVAAPLVGRVMLDLVAGWDFDVVGGLLRRLLSHELLAGGPAGSRLGHVLGHTRHSLPTVKTV